MDYAIESGNYNILKVLDRKTRKAIWIKEHLFNPEFHARIKGETPMDKEHLHELYGKGETKVEEPIEEKIEEDIEEVELDEDGEEKTEEAKKESPKEEVQVDENNNIEENKAGKESLYEGLKKADLIVIAQQKGLKVDPTWSVKKILKLLEE